MDLNKEIVNSLNSMGNLTYQVLFNYRPLKVRNKNVQVKIVSDYEGIKPAFGIFESIDRRNELTYLTDYDNVLSKHLSDKVIAGFDFSADYPNDNFKVEVNSAFRLVNIVQSHFSDLLNKIYINNVAGKLESSNMVLDVDEKAKLFAFFEDLAIYSYTTLMDSKIIRSITKNPSIAFLNSLEQFVPVFCVGPCLLHPLLNCGRYSKVFKETQLYKVASEHMYTIDVNTLSVITNKEICTSLGLNRYVPFTSTFLLLVLLGLFNPDKFPSTSSYMYMSEDGRIFDESNVMTSGIPMDALTRSSSLFFLVRQYSKRIKVKDSDIPLCFEILSTADLL